MIDLTSLLVKLKYFRICGNALKWFKSYLDCWKQYFCADILHGVLACPMQLIFFIIFIEPKDPWCQIWPLRSHACSFEFCEYWIPIFGVCAKKRCPSWELNLGPSAFWADAPPNELSGQLRIQCPQCPSVLLVSNGSSPTHQVATPSNTQHAIFEPHSASHVGNCFACL